ncbi:MAG: pilus assembly protein PilP [Methylococcales bacterium]|nr:pilus assembly protein PilP [Methylococcales bacterium]
MKRNHLTATRKLINISLFLLLSACGNNDMTDLETYVDEVIEKPGKGIEPLEKIKPSDYFLFEPDTVRSPFLKRKKIEPPPPPEEKKPEEVLEEALEEEMIEDIPDKREPNGIKPDFERVKEDLESFPLDSLSMVGSVKKNGIWGLVRFEGGIQKVRVGNYIGKNHGLILEITTLSITIEEIIEEEEDYWVKQKTQLSLKTGSDE